MPRYQRAQLVASPALGVLYRPSKWPTSYSRALLQTSRIKILKRTAIPVRSATGNFLFALSGVAVLLGTSLAAAAGSKLRKLFRRGRRPKKVPSRMSDGSVARFSVATFNLRGVMDRWMERRPVLQHCIEDMDADVLCFQECLTGEYGQDKMMLDASYNIFPCKAALFNLLTSGNRTLHLYARTVMSMLAVAPFEYIMVRIPVVVESIREKFRLESSFFRTLRDLAIAPFFGNSVACRLADAHEIKHSTLVLGDWRAAQRIEFELGDGDGIEDYAKQPHAVNSTADSRFKVWVVNMHLDHEHPDTRQKQAMQVLSWMEPERTDCSAIVLCGDFNGGPEEPFHIALKAMGFRSGYFMRHGREPEGTWPTGIQAPLMDHGDFECLDYVYVWAPEGFSLKVIDAQVFGNKPDPRDETLYPSDHAAVKVTLELRKLGPPIAGKDNNGSDMP